MQLKVTMTLMKNINILKPHHCVLTLITIAFCNLSCFGQTDVVVNTYNGESEIRATHSVTLDAGFSTPTGATFTAYISTPSCFTTSPTPSSNRNYIMVRIPQISMKNVGDIDTYGYMPAYVQTSIQYFDGLGRPLQNVQVQASPLGYDIVQPFAYDSYSREPIKYQPYVSPTCSSGFYHPEAINSSTGYQGSEQYQFYQLGNQSIPVNTNPYAQTVIEASPLNRTLEQGATGSAWQPLNSTITGSGHTVKMEYGFNNSLTDTANASFRGVKYYTADNTNDDHTRTLTDNGWYTDNQLTLAVSKDENWVSGRAGTMEVYKDNLGRVVLKRIWKTETSPLSTYYVYDDMGNLSFVLSPATIPDQGGITATLLNELCYQYRYDARKRLIEKRVPGRGDWDEMVYNDLDQLVLSRDPNQKVSGKWAFAKYDALGRNISSGLINNSDTRATLQSTINSQTVLWESRDDANSNGTNYTSTTFPLHPSVTTYHVLNYYDHNTGVDAGLADYISISYEVNRAMLVATKTNVLGTTQFINKLFSYDDDWRPRLTIDRNNHLGVNSYYTTRFTYDFVGRLMSKGKEFENNGIFSDDVYEFYAYDDQGRPLSVTDHFGFSFGNSSGDAVVVKNHYNELGQLMNKQLHSEDGGTTFLQDVDYNYNERGWLTKINDPTAITNDRLFGMELSYNTSVNGSAAQYNGNLSGIKWQTSAPTALGLVQETMTYGYGYDKLNQIITSSYGSGTTNSQTHYFDENLTYDRNGNIRSLERYSNLSNTATLIDQLRYTYDNSFQSNRLASVIDNSGNNAGLQAGTTNYTYDANGNIKSDPSKGITNIDYNALNLPQTIYRTAGNITYTYDATGRKLTVTNGVIIKNYLDGWEFNATQVTQVATPEGVARFNAGVYKFEYFLKDNIGNTRATIAKSATGTAEILQVNHYYAFGMSYGGAAYQYTVSGSENAYKYNGKEYQEETGLYDFGARFYDPVIGRWAVIDPLAEKSRRWSTYNYAFNNPLKFIDPDGMSPKVEKSDGSHDLIEIAEQIYNNAQAQASNAAVQQSIDEFQAIMDGRSDGSPTANSESSNGANEFHASGNDESDNESDDQAKGNQSANQEGGKPLPHSQELAKYGQISWVIVSSTGVSAGPLGGTFELGTLVTDKGWSQDYMTRYFSPGMAPPFFGTGFLMISPANKKYSPTFHDWDGLSLGGSGSFAYISFSGGLNKNYYVWGFGLTTTPASLDFMKPAKGTGSISLGITTLLGAPYLKETGADRRYINRMQQGGQ